MSDEDVTTIVVGQERAAEQPAPEQDWPTDEVCAAAVELARQALLEETDESQVGDHQGLIAEGPLVVTHYFAGAVPGYVGWRWAVTVARAPDSELVTIDETALLPDGDALLAPTWVPWKNRIESGDLGAGDVLVTEADDPRLIAGLTTNDVASDDDDEVLPAQWELGLGRERMLSPEGRREAAHRWYREVGPRSQLARAADLQCSTCGFLLLIGGPLGQAFGVCANGFSPVDGHVVAMDFGCGAHSETVEHPTVPVAEIVVDEVGYDEVSTDDEEPPQESAEPTAEVQEPSAGEGDPPPAAEPAVDAQEPAEPEADAVPPEDEAPAEPEAVQDPAHETMEQDKIEEGS